MALDRPLTGDEQREVRALSTRAQITGTGFTNEYLWGNFGADPVTLMERYYDAHLYVAKWGIRRLMIQLHGGRRRRSGESRPWIFRRQVHFNLG